ncbi:MULTISPECIES: hypothetical protein [Legionella]|uniref:Uncharacterized protein n=1 Tax=Legionella resiliens TaxID=2905958 RepID=A0ABS8X1G2_9GAMM|nr:MULTISPECIES: hypothetical protein [unclassified Legionella]MCE0723429.1 hypothetical protein [Legionella sp. 9fVS26]MCE3532583.1 hypothetical protein [Legionella sp. 8cVS16]QLZ68715.1 hypothetical protein FOLKNPGA_01494 [Legionella sp. PC1000]
MPFNYRSITANCGNDTLGEDASRTIIQLLQEDDAAFFVINCQEVHFGKTQEQLQKLLPDGYEVKCLSQMATHTKLDTQILPTTGMATFVIHKTGLQVSVEGEPVEARRSSRRLSGAAYNKGGLVTHFTVTRSEDIEEGISEERIKVQTVTGHLDAGDVVKRNKDWQKLYRGTVKEVMSWDELVDACPDLLLSGYDANTRNKFDKKHKTETKIWDNPNEHPELHALHLVSMAAAKYSKDETYTHTKIDQETGEELVADPKREGDAARGTLDFVTIYDGNIAQNVSREKIDKGLTVVQVGLEPDSERDHHVIISPPQTSLPLDKFDRVKNLMVARLVGVAPDIAAKILAITEGDNEDDKAWARMQLVDYYNQYLGPDGFLDKALGLHIQKLECVQRLMDDPQNQYLEKVLKKIFFDEHEWCAGEQGQLKAKQELMQTFLDSLAECKHAAGVEARITCYLDLKEKIARNEKVNAVDAFKDSAVKVYQNHYEIFETFAKKTDEDSKLRKAMNNILKLLDAIADHNDEAALKNLDPKKLDALTHIVAQCHNSFMLLQAGETHEMEKINAELISLSDEAMGSSSSVWRALADAVKFFVSLISKISPNSTLTEQVGIVQDKKLSDSIIKYNSALYKSALKEIIPQEEEESEHLLGNNITGSG